MTKQIDIKVNYTLHLSENDFKKVLEEAEMQGCGYNDAGKIETVRRYLQHEGINAVEMLLEDPNAIKISQGDVS